MGMEYLRIPKFDKYQHFKDRRPIWIKLYNSILDDYDFLQLAPAQRYAYIGLLLLASRLDNKIPNDEKYLCRMIDIKSIDLKTMIDMNLLSGDIKLISSCHQVDDLEKRREEKSISTNGSDTASLVAGKLLVPYGALTSFGETYPNINVKREIAKMEAWVMANPDKKKKKWLRFINNWLANASKQAPAIVPKPKAYAPASASAVEARLKAEGKL